MCLENYSIKDIEIVQMLGTLGMKKSVFIFTTLQYNYASVFIKRTQTTLLVLCISLEASFNTYF